MKTTDGNRAIATVLWTMATLNVLFLFGNGLFMLVAPSGWYHLVPGVTQTSPLNQHFVRDIGLIQMFLGAGIGMIQPMSRFVLWSAATAWLSAHAVLHLWEVAVGICHPSGHRPRFPGRHAAGFDWRRAHDAGLDAFATDFYRRLFALHPEIELLFLRVEMTTMRLMLMRMIGVTVRGLHNLPKILPDLRALGMRQLQLRRAGGAFRFCGGRAPPCAHGASR
jgi:uncharacterized protein YjeT (DUF2065 family)